MRRSLAPSQISGETFVSSTETKRKRRCVKETLKENTEPTNKLPFPTSQNLSEYESLIAKILNRPFKVPIADYVPEYCTNRSLGLKRSTIRRALHDPFSCNALVLYEPPQYSEHEKLTSDPTKIQVHVVVDPVLSNVLRPHQREGVKFMYDCVTGVKGLFNGCIMADEMVGFIMINLGFLRI